MKRLLAAPTAFRSRSAGVFVGVTLSVGVVVLVSALASSVYIAAEPENGTLSGAATVINDAAASNGKAVKFANASSPTPTPSACPNAKNTPGGPDPWGGCFPYAGNTGVPAGTNLVAVNSSSANPPDAALPTDNTGWAYSDADGYITVTATTAVIDGISSNGGVYVPAGRNLTVKNSAVGLINHAGASLDVEHSTINGGTDLNYSSITGGDHITVKYSNLYNGAHEVLCYHDCDVENNWLHDNADGTSVGAHQNGFLSTSGSNFTILHNSVYCVGGCTADIAFLNQGLSSDATVSNNLLVSAPMAAYCVYPGPNSSPSQYPSSNMVWTNNVFQRGDHTKLASNSGGCGYYGPVYGWFPNIGTGNVWSGNTWDDGTPLNP